MAFHVDVQSANDGMPNEAAVVDPVQLASTSTSLGSYSRRWGLLPSPPVLRADSDPPGTE